MKKLTEEKLDYLNDRAYKIRRMSMEMITYSSWGHIGGAFSMAELLAALYFHEMNLDPKQPLMESRDRFILSKAHASPALYAALALRGFFPEERIYEYCEPGGLEGHTHILSAPGIEASGGPLGMGLSVAVGMALGLRQKENPRSRIYCLLGEGDIEKHNGVIADAIRKTQKKEKIDVVVLAQLSMSVFSFSYPYPEKEFGINVLNSGETGFLKAASVLKNL